jgi:hypothetical protein
MCAESAPHEHVATHADKVEDDAISLDYDPDSLYMGPA